MIVDTSALVAFFDGDDLAHEAVLPALLQGREPLVVSPYVVAELGCLVASRHGVDRELVVLRELASGAWDLPAMALDDLTKAREVVKKYRDQDIGVTDASPVVLAERYQTRTIATLDHRHFGVLRPPSGGRFSIVP